MNEGTALPPARTGPAVRDMVEYSISIWSLISRRFFTRLPVFVEAISGEDK